MDGAPTAPETIKEAEQEITRVPLVLHRRNFSWLTERISGVVEQPAPRWWWVAFAITSSAATFGLFCIGYQISTGVGTWGNQIPVGWAWDITNFVFWVSATPAHSSPPFCFCFGKNGARRSTVPRKR